MKTARFVLLLMAVGLSILGGIYLGDRESVSTPDAKLSERKAPPITISAPTLTDAPANASGSQVVASEPAPLFLTLSWTPHVLNLRPLAPGEPIAQRLVLARAPVKRESLPVLADLKKGDRVTFPLRDGETVHGIVNLVLPDAHGWIRVGGSLQDSARGSFALGQREGVFSGIIKTPAKERAYVLETSANAQVTLSEKPMSSVECVGYRKKPAPDNATSQATQAAATLGGATVEASASITVPPLDSLPTATAVLYLDFDGEMVTDTYWNDGYTINAQPVVLGSTKISPAQITDVWVRVAEDFRPFNISVTTVRDRYDNAAVGHRMRCIVTSSGYWIPDAGGVAGMNSFDEAAAGYLSDDVPCWAFASSNYSTADISGTISHEAGHTFGLSHDSQFYSVATGWLKDEYYSGHGKWGPIMGTTYDRPISQWSICEFANGSNYLSIPDPIDYPDYTSTPFKEDDVSIIGNGVNGFGYLPDDASSFANGTVLPNTGIFIRTGIISGPTDIDAYTFSTRGGSAVINVKPAAVEPDLDVQFDLRDSTGTNVVPTVTPAGNLATSLTKTLTAGTYTLFIRSAGDGNPVTTGYSTYGSIGQYTISGTFAAVPDAVPTIATHPVTQTIAIGGKTTFSVTASSNIPLTYTWQKDGNPITGATAATYTISSTQPAHQGSYTCIVSNSVGPVTSNPALLNLNFKPSITIQPIKSTVGANGSTPLSVSVVAIGTPTLAYQWQKNNVNIPGATSSTYSVATPQFSDGGTYRCIISNAFGSVTSAGALVTATSAPILTLDVPPTKGMPLGGSSTLAITAVGSPTLLYQWFKDNVIIPGGTKATLSLSGINAAIAATYRCEVRNTVASVVNTTVSANCVVTVGIAPKVTTQPAPTHSLNVGDALNLSVVASGDPTLAYQWQHDGTNISGANSASFALGSTTWADRGVYRCVVTNSFGTATSANATVTVKSPPIIVTSPVSRKVAKGGKTVLTVVATGSPTLKYVWHRDSVVVPGASASLTVVGTTTATYDCLVSNTYGSAPSASVLVTVEDAPKITALPTSALAALGGSFSRAAVVTGSPNIAYQWKKNNIPLPGQTTSTLQLTNLQASDVGTYTLVATNDVGTATSNGMKLGLQTAPSITTDPQSQTAYAFQNVVFTAAAAGTATLKYQWTKDGVDIPGATTTKLTLTSVQAAPPANYALRVTNSVGTATSLPATLTVIPVAAPGTLSFTPGQGKVGHYIRVLGTNLNWTTGAQMQKIGGGSVNAAFVIVSPTEVLVTVPSGVELLSAISLITRSGTFTTSAAFLTRTGETNDLFVDARIIPGTGGTLTGTVPTSFHAESGESNHAHLTTTNSHFYTSFSAWHAFTPTASGTYSVSTSGSSFDTRIGIYTGNSVSTLTPEGENDDADYSYGIYTSYARFEATAGTTYYIAVDGFSYWYDYGPYTLAVKRLIFTIPKAIAARTMETSGAVTADETSITLGGSTAPAIAWSPEISTGAQLEYSATVAFTSSPDAQDRCGLFAVNDQGTAPFGLNLSAQSGALNLVDAEGNTSPTGQTLVPDQDYDLVIRVDNATHTWGALLNGEWICQNIPWPTTGGHIEDITSQTVPGPSTVTHTTLTLKNATISTGNE